MPRPYVLSVFMTWRHFISHAHMKMMVNYFSICLVLFAFLVVPYAIGGSGIPVSGGGRVRKEERWGLVSSEYGEISGLKISDGRNGWYHLHFITTEPHSFLLPLYLYSEMVFYVNSGTATLSSIDVEKDDEKLRQVNLHTGDIYRLTPQTVFYLENISNESQKLEIYAIFPDSTDELQNEEFQGVYAGVHDLLLRFDNPILQAALGVPDEVIEELRGRERQPLIVQGQAEPNTSMSEVHSRVIRTLLGTKNNHILDALNKKKPYSILEADRDVQNQFGWSLTTTKKEAHVLKHSDFGVLMVNLTKGVMMGPHWNPKSAEVAIVLEGRGMVQVGCPGIEKETGCKMSRFRVEEGDVFVVPRYHPVVQISFNNHSFVFMGFTTRLKNNHDQYLTGKLSILKKLDKMVLAKSFNVSNTTIDKVFQDDKKRESSILECTSCAERLMEEEKEREEEGGGGAEREGESAAKAEEEMAEREREREAEEAGEGGGTQIQ